MCIKRKKVAGETQRKKFSYSPGWPRAPYRAEGNLELLILLHLPSKFQDDSVCLYAGLTLLLLVKQLPFMEARYQKYHLLMC